MNRISLNVIVFNEEARLEACLSDARDHVDEIVVVDQMSTDGTAEIAQRLADVYIRDVNHGYAEPSRELAASRSSGEWILVLDADEQISELLKTELRGLVERDSDGYWIRKENVVGGTDRSTILHYRLCRRTRVRFDPNLHGGARPISDNVATFDAVGIVHEKSVAEQIFDDARYERLALEDDAPTSAKRNWLSHNRALREDRARGRPSDLEALVPADAERVLIVGDIPIELAGCALTRVDRADAAVMTRDRIAALARGSTFDAAILAPVGDDPLASLRAVAGLVRPGGVIVGTAPAARNRRRIEELVGGLLSGGARPDPLPAGGSTRQALLDDLSAAGLDVRWMRLVRDGWLDPLALRPDGSGTVVESEDFLLRSVAADVAEELTAAEIVFAAAVRPRETDLPGCSIVLAAGAGGHPLRFADALRESAPRQDYELVVVHRALGRAPLTGAVSVVVAEGTGLAPMWNAGARRAATELLVFVSADAVPMPGWLDALVDAYRSRPDTAAVGSKVVAEDGTVEHAGLVLGADRIPYRVYQGEAASVPQVSRPRIMPAVAADGMLTARARFVAVGGFDETLGEDLTDVDLCLRLRARGLPIIYSPEALLRSPPPAVPGTRGAFRRSARDFRARWSPTTLRSDDVVCMADGCDTEREANRSWRLPRPDGPSVGGLPAIAWTSHFLEHGGYTEEARTAVEALDDAGLHVVANPVTWDQARTPLPRHKAERLERLMERDLPADFVHVAHIGANRFKPHPDAIRNIGRTMFETDGLPREWRDQCNAMDEVWVPSEHNLQSFASAGVAPSKLHIVPETFDAELFDPGVAPLPVAGLTGFVFLSVFSWIERKGWDVLIRAWFKEFAGHDDVTLVLKTDIGDSPRETDPRRELESFVRDRLDRDPGRGPPVVLLDRPLDHDDLPRLYRAADAFVLASHGEGWGRPYMEAMAMGLPTIATRWSGNLEFMNDENSYLVDYKLTDAPGDPWRRGQHWAQPSVSDLRRAMRRVYEQRGEAAATGLRARTDVLVSCRPELVAEAVRERLEAIARHPLRRARGSRRPPDGPLAPPTPRRKTRPGRRISACVVVSGSPASLPRCRSSLRDVADAIVVVDAGSGEDMAAARNDALDRAAGDWVLMLDATHTLDPASVDRVRRLVAAGRFVGYAAREVHQFGLDGSVSTVEQRTAVLFPRHPELRYVGRVGEQLLAQRPDLEFRLRASGVVLRQHDHRADRRDPVALARRQLPLLERSVREAPDEPFHLYNLGIALHHLGLGGEAASALRRAVALAPRRAAWRAPAHVSLARVLASQGRTAGAVKQCRAATRSAPGWAGAWCALGGALVDAGRLQAALRAYTRGLDCDGATWVASDGADDTAWQLRAGLGKIHLACHEYGEAADCLAGALALNPRSAELHLLLARAHEAVGRSLDAGRHLERAITIAPSAPQAYAAFGEFFTKKAETALLSGLAANTESRMLLERIERLRAARAIP